MTSQDASGWVGEMRCDGKLGDQTSEMSKVTQCLQMLGTHLTHRFQATFLQWNAEEGGRADSSELGHSEPLENFRRNLVGNRGKLG
jgi:hypothetical protein